jgi:hypothetical protein
VLRGGSWNNNTNNVRSSNRNNNTPDNTNNNIGFRVASTQGSLDMRGPRLEPLRVIARERRSKTEGQKLKVKQ